MKTFVRSTGPGKLVWPGMILAGFALSAFVWAAWPEPTVRIIRLPDGESMPKTVRAAAPAQPPVAKTVIAVAPVPAAAKRQPPPVAVVAPEPVRVLAAVEPEPSAGPAPVPSDLELSGDYEQQSPERLGAKPLPGAELTPEPPPVAG